MELSTTTGIYQLSGNTESLRDMNEVLRVLREIGYNTIDLSFCFHNKPDYLLRDDDWERKIDQVGETAAKLGITFYQSHLPFVKGCSTAVDPCFRKPDYQEYFDECTRRAYMASGRLGVRWAVAHPLTFPQYNFENKVTLEANRAYNDKFVELGMRYGTGTAFENMLPSLDRSMPFRYCQHYEQLIELVDSYADPQVGVCWDTGHANQMKLDQPRALRTIGSRLKTLHINDNHYGNRDEHLLPYMGTIDWDGVLDALVDIGYEGSMNYETGKVTIEAYGDIQLELVKMVYRNGEYLMKRYEQALQKRKA